LEICGEKEVQLLYFSNLGLCKLVGILESELLGLVHCNGTGLLPKIGPSTPGQFLFFERTLTWPGH
jgi:hypothetical protein